MKQSDFVCGNRQLNSNEQLYNIGIDLEISSVTSIFRNSFVHLI